MITELYHTRPLRRFSPAYDLGPELLRHSIPDSKVLLSLGRCRRSIFHASANVWFLDLIFIAGPIASNVAARNHPAAAYPQLAPRARRTCTWPPAPAHGLPHPHPHMAAHRAAHNVSTRIHQAHTTHPEKQAYHLNNYSTSTDNGHHSFHGAAIFEMVRRCVYPVRAPATGTKRSQTAV